MKLAGGKALSVTANFMIAPMGAPGGEILVRGRPHRGVPVPRSLAVVGVDGPVALGREGEGEGEGEGLG